MIYDPTVCVIAAPRCRGDRHTWRKINDIEHACNTCSTRRMRYLRGKIWRYIYDISECSHAAIKDGKSVRKDIDGFSVLIHWDGWWIGRCALLGAVSQGRTFLGLVKNMQEAIAVSIDPPEVSDG